MSNLFAEELRRAANGWGRDMGQAQLLNSAAREIDRLEGLAELCQRDYRDLDEHHAAVRAALGLASDAGLDWTDDEILTMWREGRLRVVGYQEKQPGEPNG